MENKNHNHESTHNLIHNVTHKKKLELGTPHAILIGSAIIGLCLIIGLKVSGGSSNSMLDPDKIFQGRAFTSNEMLMGKVSNDVIFLTYSDTECPFCKMFNDNVILKIKESYKGKIGFAYRKYPLPMHPQARIESLAALCARDQGGVEKYEAYTQSIFKKTKSNNGLDLSEIDKIASSLGLDMNKFHTCNNASSTQDLLNADISDGERAGVEGTPYSLVLVRRGSDYQVIAKINGARDYAYVSKAIDLGLKYK